MSKFWIAQLVGALAWVVLLVSYYRKTTNKILSFHIVSTLLDAFHYFLLGAYAGSVICIFETIRDYGYFKSDQDNSIFIATIPLYLIISFLTCVSFVDLLPVLSSVVDGYALTKSKKTVIIGAVITYTCWVIYAISVKSYIGILADGILVISNLSILLFDKDLLKGKEIRMK